MVVQNLTRLRNDRFVLLNLYFLPDSGVLVQLGRGSDAHPPSHLFISQAGPRFKFSP